MSTFWQYILLVIVLHLGLGVCFYYLLENIQGWFILSEVLLVTSLGISLSIYSQFRKPIKLIRSGIEALADEDFNVRFSKTPSVEMNQLIEVYNQMIDKIREERIAIAEQHYFLEQLIQASPNGIILLNYDGKVDRVNAAAVSVLEQFDLLEEDKDKFVAEYLQRDDPDGFIISSGGFQKFKVQPGTFVHRGFDRMFYIIQDLSRDLLETEKKAYGKVIRMMAHEVNNSIA